MQDLLPFEKVERKVFVKKEAESSKDHGCKPEERKVEALINYGIVNLNKPSGPTSHQVVDYVKKILKINKAGHSGSLDPKVTGVLPIALGRGTRIVQILLKAGKEYIGVMHLHKEVSEKELQKTLSKFTGKIEQLPPIRSAVKRRFREREIYYFKILEIKDKDVLFKVGCEAGTYIRKLIHDFGNKLKVGAHMASLVRTKVAFFNDKNWFNLQDLMDSFELFKSEGDESYIRKVILPVEKGVEHLSKIWVLDSSADSLCHGADLNIPGVSKFNDFKENDNVAVMSLKNELICLGLSKVDSSEIMKKEKGLIVKTKKVFMERGVYPKYITKK